jgi:hypothetical protein
MVPGGALPAAAACEDSGVEPELGTAAVRGGGAGYPLAARGRGAAAVTVAGVVVGLLAVAWMAVLCHARVRRLHRLHIRVDAARAGLEAALARRAAAAAAAGVVVPVAPASWRPSPRAAGGGPARAPGGGPARAPGGGPARAPGGGPPWAPGGGPPWAPGGGPSRSPGAGSPWAAGGGLPRLPGAGPPRAAEACPPRPQEPSDTSTLGQRVAVDPEAAANALGRALARLDRAALPADVRAALVDAEQLLVLARRVHNDAVRDTLGLRSHRLVRWLRLAGTASMPAYFEIADPAPTLTYDRVSPSQE